MSKLYNFCVENRPCDVCIFWDIKKNICIILEVQQVEKEKWRQRK